jgi:hypothetical protein
LLIQSWTKFVTKAFIGLLGRSAGFFAKHDKKPGVRYQREGALLVRRSRREGWDSASELAKSDPRAPGRRSRPLDVIQSWVVEGPGSGDNPAAAVRGRDPSLRPCRRRILIATKAMLFMGQDTK